MNPPRLVQRYRVSEDGIITPEHMGRLDPVFRESRDSALKSMCHQALSLEERQTLAIVDDDARAVSVHVLAADGFDFDSYDHHVQFLALNGSRAEDESHFFLSVLHCAGFTINPEFINPETGNPETQIWLDTSNEVIFTLNPKLIHDIEHMFEEMRNVELAASN